MCDRIGVMSAGRLVAVFERGQWSEQSLLAAAFSDATGRAATPATATSPLSDSNPARTATAETP